VGSNSQPWLLPVGACQGNERRVALFFFAGGNAGVP
jgi:hypothetical protein